MSTTQGDGRGQVILELKNVHTFYGSIEALKGISIDVREGEIVTLIGANGAGKSTTLRSINGLNHPKEGTIVFKGTDITDTAPHEIVRMGISQSPEGRHVFPRMSVLENLEMGAFQRTDKANFPEDLDRVFHLFPRLAERKQQKAGTMSKIRSTRIGASPSDGSSSMSSLGLAMSARPIAHICCSPPLSVPASCSRRSARMGNRPNTRSISSASQGSERRT